MTLYTDDWLTIHGGDARTVLADLPDESVHCVVTSPPYWGLRDYGTATWVGGDEGCDHRAPSRFDYALNPGLGPTGVQDQRSNVGSGSAQQFRDVCGKCNATRIDSQLGLEATPEEYVANIVAVFREVRRVLRKDGTLWLNLGDSYASHDPGGYREGEFLNPDGRPPVKGQARNRAGNYRPGGLKPKDLVGIPWRVAFALQADGWYLRSDIVWSKPNPMPESVTDRPTKSHEYIFLLTRSPRYYFNSDAVREVGERRPSDVDWQTRRADGEPVRRGDPALTGHTARFRVGTPETGRNIRSVWTIATQPYPGAHFAVFPEKLVEPCIPAGTSERGVCPECGVPWVRVVAVDAPNRVSDRRADFATNQGRRDGYTGAPPSDQIAARQTTGWQPSCAHVALRPSPAVVLDCFAGSGTVARVANRLSRRAILIDLNPEYLRQQMERNRDIPLGLEVPA